ncbi:phosphatidylinositol-specific phospholipase C domain-containing protein [Kitasatospora sp. NPDC089509]|uniref:phosphatidylinositol-specific phospholipase C domain-containing protein n=1 Tax=Kitasatospora sp. NPDC089509 TaxID=3364079 RepID=UPI00382D385D
MSKDGTTASSAAGEQAGTQARADGAGAESAGLFAADVLAFNQQPLVNWMGRVPDNTRLSDMSIPGTHQSCTRHDGVSFGYTRCQDGERTLYDQLACGTRYVDIRCRVAGFGSNWSWAIHHGPVYQEMMFGDAVGSCRLFLSNHPSETIVMRIQSNDGDHPRYREIWNSYKEDLFYIATSPTGIPTLGQVRGKIVLISGNPYLGEGLHWPNALDVQDNYSKPSMDSKKSSILNHLNKAINAGPSKSRLFVNHISANGQGNGTTPWGYADALNPYTRNRLNDLYAPGKSVGVIAMDYWNRPYGDVTSARYVANAYAVVISNPRKPAAGVHDGRSYLIWNKGNGKALNPTGSGVNALHPQAGHQRWTVSGSKLIAGSKQLRVSGNQLSLVSSGGTDWAFHPVANGTFRITPLSSGTNGAGLYSNGRVDGVAVTMSTSTDHFSEWYFDPYAPGVLAEDIEEQTVRACAEILSVDDADNHTVQVTVTNNTAGPVTHWSVFAVLPEGVTLDPHATRTADAGTTITADIFPADTGSPSVVFAPAPGTPPLQPGDSAGFTYTGHAPSREVEPIPIVSVDIKTTTP